MEYTPDLTIIAALQVIPDREGEYLAMVKKLST